jgi:hypothetical protein
VNEPCGSAHHVRATVLAWALAIVVTATLLAAPRDARALGWLLQFLPVSFAYRIRANHEFAMMAALLFAVYSTERARTRTAWSPGMIAGFCSALLVKGVFAVAVPVACALWLVARDGDAGGLRTCWKAWAGVAAVRLAAGHSLPDFTFWRS